MSSRNQVGYGPVVDPNNTDWSRYQVPGHPEYGREATDLRIRKMLATSRMRRFRSVPVSRRVWYVTLTVAEADQGRDFGSHDLPVGLTFTPREFWCKSRRAALRLIDRDRDAGGLPAMYPVDYRLCPVCGRMLLGPEAHDYQAKMRRPMRSWQFPDGPACKMDCKPKGRGPGGERLNYQKGNHGQSRQV